MSLIRQNLIIDIKKCARFAKRRESFPLPLFLIAHRKRSIAPWPWHHHFFSNIHLYSLINPSACSNCKSNQQALSDHERPLFNHARGPRLRDAEASSLLDQALASSAEAESSASSHCHSHRRCGRTAHQQLLFDLDYARAWFVDAKRFFVPVRYILDAAPGREFRRFCSRTSGGYCYEWWNSRLWSGHVLDYPEGAPSPSLGSESSVSRCSDEGSTANRFGSSSAFLPNQWRIYRFSTW